MERDVELAIRHAIDLARSRAGALASITLRGAGTAAAVTAAADATLRRLGVDCPEVNFESDDGPLRLSTIELRR